MANIRCLNGIPKSPKTYGSKKQTKNYGDPEVTIGKTVQEIENKE